MTALADEAVRREAARLGALLLLDKPFPPSALCHVLDDYARSLR
jgi:CheY-like chemotaxis protein